MRFTSVVACAGLILFVAIAVPLFERVENVVDASLSAAHENLPMAFVRILPDRRGARSGQGRTHRTRLSVHDTSRLLRHQGVRILLGTLGTRPDLERAELAVEGTRCVYATAPGAAFPNNETLELVRGDACAPLDGPPSGKMELTVTLRNHARIVLWTHTAPAASVTIQTIIVDPSAEPPGADVFVLAGRLVDEGAASDRYRRVDLLAYVWQVGPSSSWIWAVVALGALAISIGFLGLWNPTPLTSTSGGAAGRGFSAFLLMIGLGVLYAVLTPPFQAPDEPHHFVAFAELVDRPELAVQADEWTARGHASRLRFRPAEKFTPADVGNHDRVTATPHAPDSSVRGGAVHMLWRSVAPLLRSVPAPRVFLWLRLLNVLVLAVLIGVSIALLIRYGQVPSPHLLAFPILFIPTLPFFGMHVSNHGPLIAVYVLLSAGLVLVVLNRRSDPVSGLLVGCGWAAAIALSRSAMPLAPMIAAVAGARLLFGPADRRMSSTAMFWTGLIVPLLFVLSTSGGAAYVAANTRMGGGTLPSWLQTLSGAATRSPWLLAFGIPLLVALELSLSRLRSRSGARLRSAVAGITRWSAVAAAAIVSLLMIGSLFIRYPVLATIDPSNRPPALEYTGDALWAGLTMLRFGGPDYRSSVTFWGGFGWLETLPSDRFISLLTAGTGVALVALLLHVAKTSETRRAFFLAACLSGFAATLAAYAFSLTRVETAIDLAGRYVFGLYLTTVVICWSGIALIPEGTSRPRLRSLLSSGCVVACTGIYVYCLRLILYRYF
ncbi:MAG: hypothetical protein H0W53_02255 [Acidobacteria bacterium]|nr:hypothetical protein [Acidobacteriota bacterium]